jgi:hypothetical protein
VTVPRCQTALCPVAARHGHTNKCRAFASIGEILVPDRFFRSRRCAFSAEGADWRRSTMPRETKKKPSLKLPALRSGNWRGEILGSCTVNFGQVVQPGPPRQSVEFTYVTMPAAFTMPEARFTWPGVIMIMTPTPMKTEFSDAGHLLKAEHLPSLSLSLEVTRGQFSDMPRMLCGSLDALANCSRTRPRLRRRRVPRYNRHRPAYVAVDRHRPCADSLSRKKSL